MMTREQLRRFVDEAEGKHQTALVIWKNWRIYKEYHISAENNERYQERMRRAEKGEEGTCFRFTRGEGLESILFVLPIKKVKTSPEFFEKALRLLQSEEGTNPVVLEPMHELSELCEKE